MIRIALTGAAVAGLYGALHDQISYSISPEYFTKMKFYQFSYADFGWPPRVFVSEIGFLATWWVGLFAGWFLARIGLTEIPIPVQRQAVVKAFAIVLLVTATCALIGVLLGWVVTQSSDLNDWNHHQHALGIKDLPSFVIVAYLHLAGYVGALIGCLLAIVYVRRCVARSRL